MGANRRLQSEIDRTLKKVNEGIEIFDQIWDKVSCPDAAALISRLEYGIWRRSLVVRTEVVSHCLVRLLAAGV